MHRSLYILFFFSLVACSSGTTSSSDNFSLAKTLAERQAKDSLIQEYFAANLNKLPVAELISARDSVFTDNCAWLQAVFAESGLPEVDEVGPLGVRNFWIMVQHCDGSPAFQEHILAAMENDTAYQRPAFRKEIAYLTDRVLKNTGRPQRYATQLEQKDDMRLVLPAVEDSCRVDALRIAAGMAPLAVYYNDYLKWHFSANEAHYQERGISEPLQFYLPVACQPPYTELRAVLEDMYTTDQGYRKQIAEMKVFDGELVARMNEQDSLNQERLGTFLRAYGWLAESEIGERAADAIFYVLQHGEVATMEQYLPKLQELAAVGKAKKTHAA
ncbi:MAG: DUF6624 domain-containing protein, partial [Bacteroidota bacterium]